MSRWLGWIAIGWLVAICAGALVLYGGRHTAPTLDERVQAVAAQLKCPVCVGESVADSPSRLSQSIRGVIRQDLRNGESPDEIKAQLIRAYGDKIVLAPPKTGLGAIAWIGPPLLVLAGAGLLVTLLIDWRSRGRGSHTPSRQEYLDRVRVELRAQGDVE